MTHKNHTSKNTYPLMAKALVGYFAILAGLLGVLVVTSFSNRNLDNRSKASSSTTVVCDATSYCTSESECYGGNGIAGPSCGQGTVCCTPQAPDIVAMASGDIAIEENCCETVGYGSCRHSDLSTELANFENGYYAWISRACPAAKTQTPYNGQINTVPGRIEAENFDVGGPEVAYSDLSKENQGTSKYRDGESVDLAAGNNYSNGHKLGWIGSGEWVEYTVDVTKTGTYTFAALVSTTSNASPEIYVYVNGKQSANLLVPNTGGWNNFTEVSAALDMLEGTHVVRLAFPDGNFDLDYFEIRQTVGQEPGNGNGLTAKYYSNKDFTALAYTQIDPTVRFRSWVEGYPREVGPDTFSISWEGFVQAPQTGEYIFYTNSDDGNRLYVNGSPMINDWSDHSMKLSQARINLTAGQRYPIRVEYYQGYGGAGMELLWKLPSEANKVIIPSSALFPAEGTASTKGKFVGIEAGQQVGKQLFVSYEANRDTTERVEYYIDGNLVQTERAYPFSVGGDDGTNLNPKDISNLAAGSHTLMVKVYPKNGGVYYEDEVSFNVAGTPVSQNPNKGKFVGISDGQLIKGNRITVEYDANKATTQRVEFYLNDKLVHKESTHQYFLGGNLGPIGYGYNVSDYRGETIKLLVKVFKKDGSLDYEDSLTFTVANESAAQGSFNGITDGQTFGTQSGISYQAPADKVARVEFYIDGKFVHKESGSPFFLGGNEGSIVYGYDLSSHGSGNHELRVKVFPKNGGTYYEDAINFRVQ